MSSWTCDGSAGGAAALTCDTSAATCDGFYLLQVIVALTGSAAAILFGSVIASFAANGLSRVPTIFVTQRTADREIIAGGM